MRSEDMDVIARVIAQQVKQTVEKKFEARKSDTNEFEDQIRDLVSHNEKLTTRLARSEDTVIHLTKTVETLLEKVKGLENDNTNLNAFGEKALDKIKVLTNRLEEAEKNLNTRVTAKEFDAVALTVAKTVKTDDLENIVKSVDQLSDRFGNMDVEKTLETMWDQQWRNEVAAMIPNLEEHDGHLEKRFEALEATIAAVETRAGPPGKDADPTEVATIVHDLVMKELPDMVLHAMPEPPKPLEPSDLQVIEAVKHLYPSIRQDLVRRLPAMKHRGVWKEDIQYDVGDEVIRNGSTFRMMEPTTDAPPSDAWQMISQGKIGKKGAPGKDGDKGEKGDTGPAGTGVKDVIFTEGMLVFELTDGEVKEFDLTEFIDLIIKRLGETP